MRVQKLMTVMLAVATLAAPACGKSEEQKQAEALAEAAKKLGEAAAQGAQGAQAGANAMAQGLQQMANAMSGAAPVGPDGKPLPPVDFEKLIDLLPTPSG